MCNLRDTQTHTYHVMKFYCFVLIKFELDETGALDSKGASSVPILFKRKI